MTQRDDGCVEDDWDFYPCRVDDAPGSIFVNLALARRLPGLPENTLYAVRITMADGGPHGMGSAQEADALYPAEDALTAELAGVGLRFIGRLRNHGDWQSTWMGPPGREADVERAADSRVGPVGRRFAVLAKPDAEWTYYTRFLFPNEERMRWIQDRRVVDALQRHGDPLTARRRVDHWIYFPDRGAGSAFAAAVAADGFHLEGPVGDAPDFGVQVYRTDSAQLDDIHEVTGLLTDLARRFDGRYDGWETSVETG